LCLTTTNTIQGIPRKISFPPNRGLAIIFVMPYPSELESWWLAAACGATGCADHAAALQRLEATAARLSDQFTVDRPTTFRDYASDPVSRAAYGIMFFPQTFARVSLVIGECLAVGALDRKENVSRRGAEVQNLQVLDLGCGSGASTLAAARMLQDLPLALHAVDHAPAALAALRQVFEDCRMLWPAASLTTHARDVHADGIPGAFDLILASFVLNELFPDGDDPRAERWLRRQWDRLAPGGCLVILDPAGAVTCERLQRLRDRLACNSQCTIVAPCPHRRPCPMLGAHCGFCHDVRSWRVPDSVNLINRRMFRSVHDLKYGLLVLRRTAAAPQADTPATRFRMVGPMNRDKARVATYGCCNDGMLRKIELMTRGLSRPQIDALAAYERGDRLRMVNPKLLGDGRTWRAEALAPEEKMKPQNLEGGSI
jgi:SAM-dependent methyltransferase